MTYVGNLMEKNIESLVYIMVDDLFIHVLNDVKEPRCGQEIDDFSIRTFDSLIEQSNQDKILSLFYSFIDELHLLKSEEAKRLLRNKYLNRIKAFMSLRAFYAFILANDF